MQIKRKHKKEDIITTNQKIDLEQAYLTRCLESPTYVTIQRIQEIYLPFVASNYNLKQ